MINHQFTRFSASNKFSLELLEFIPRVGYEKFLREFCRFAGEQFIDWAQGVESGIGHITFDGNKITVVWSDTPFCLSFDCINKESATSLHTLIARFLVEVQN